MAQVKLELKLLQATENPVALIYAACRQCYSEQFAADIFTQAKKQETKQEEFISKVIASGHLSPLEHVSFTFAVSGVSRALSHQLVRHRIASYSQQSQRYVKADDFGYVMPQSINRDQVLKAEFEAIIAAIRVSYDKILRRFEQKGITGEKANQDARFILPQAAETKLVVTMNCRQLLHFFKQRCCERAQWEIRHLADKMLTICKNVLPCVFLNAGAKCIELGYCPEIEKFSCGKYPLKQTFMKDKK